MTGSDGLRSLKDRTRPKWSRLASRGDPRDQIGSRRRGWGRSGEWRPESQGPSGMSDPAVPYQPAAPDPGWAVGSGKGRPLTHVLRVQLHGRHLLQRNVPRPAISAAPEAAEHRGSHHAGTTNSDAATACCP